MSERLLASGIEELLDVIAERVAVKVDSRLRSTTTSTHRQRLLSIQQAALYLGRTKDAVQHLVSAGKVPSVRADKRIFLDVRDLDRWIEQSKHHIE